MQIQDTTTRNITVDTEDLYAVLYLVPVHARDGAFRRLAAALPGFDVRLERCFICGAFMGLDLYCQCEELEALPR